MDDHRDADLEQQQLAFGGLAAIDGEIVEADTIGDGTQGACVPAGEVLIEVGYEARLFRALFGALAHPGIEIMSDPVLGDRHVAGERPAADQGDAVLSKPSVRSAIVDERLDAELALRPLLQIGDDRRRIVEPAEAIAGMRASWPRNDGKCAILDDGVDLDRPLADAIENLSLIRADLGTARPGADASPAPAPSCDSKAIRSGRLSTWRGQDRTESSISRSTAALSSVEPTATNATS